MNAMTEHEKQWPELESFRKAHDQHLSELVQETANNFHEKLVERLRAVDHMSVEDCFLQSPLFSHAAEALTLANERIARLEEALTEAVAVYGREGGPWNVPSDPGGWLDRARAALKGGV